MKYISIDIETTGLNPETDQILEFGAVIEDTLQPGVAVEDLPAFRRIIRHDRLSGTPLALMMNTDIIHSIAFYTPKDPQFCTIKELTNEFRKFLRVYFKEDNHHHFEFVVAGKNFSSFDLQFLKRVPEWTRYIQPRRRVLDPAILYFDPIKDEVPPSLEECLRRAGFDGNVRHKAIGDAQDVIRVLRKKFLEQGRGSCPGN